MTGRTENAEKAIEELSRESVKSRAGFNCYYIAGIYTALANREKALHWLEKGYAESGEGLAMLKVDPLLDPLRDDPRFVSLLERLGVGNPVQHQIIEAEWNGRPS